MYDLPYYKESSELVVRQFIDEHPFAFLTGSDRLGKPVATQVPVVMEERDGRSVLRGHMMKNTAHHKAFLQNENVLAVFSGNHTYVSGAWYQDPHTPSTWNYMSVHARGTIRFLSEAGLEEVLTNTSLHFEGHNHESPTVYENLPDELKKKLLPFITAFEITVSEMNHVFKLSQDRDIKSYLNIIENLKERGEDGRNIAAEMEKRINEVFGKDRTD